MSAPSWTTDTFLPATGGAVDGHPSLMRVVRTNDGSEYIWMFGCSSNAVGALVTFTSAGVTSLTAGNDVGRVAVSMAANTSTTTYSWYQIKGYHAAVKADSVAAANGLFIDGTAGRVDDDSVAGDMIWNMFATAASSNNLVAVYMDHPFVHNTVPA